MPLYAYTCDRCRVKGLPRTLEEQKKVDERNDAPSCPECKQQMKLAPSAPSPNFPGAAAWRG